LFLFLWDTGGKIFCLFPPSGPGGMFLLKVPSRINFRGFLFVSPPRVFFSDLGEGGIFFPLFPFGFFFWVDVDPPPPIL